MPSRNIDYLNVDHVPSRVNHYTIMYPMDGGYTCTVTQSIGQYDSKSLFGTNRTKNRKNFLDHQIGISNGILTIIRIRKS